MKILGLITEYNPFHNGHLYHLDQSKALVKPDVVVAVMSGNFLQRGEPAIMDKWTRAKTAVDNGVDLVIELPTYFSTASAETFALGSVALLERLGATDLVFGTEAGDLSTLEAIADLVEAPTHRYQEVLSRALDAGFSYPAARQQAIEAAMADRIDFKANNILGIAYLRAIRKLKASIRPMTIQRIHNDYKDDHITGAIASATAVRAQLKSRPVDWSLVKSVVPESTYKALWDCPVYTVLDDFHTIFNSIALREGASGIKRCRDVGEGLENKLINELTTLGTLTDMAMAVKSKRYTLTRIQRLMTAVLLGIEPMAEEEVLSHLDYCRVLAFNAAGAKLIRKVKRAGQLYPITNLGRDLKKYRKKNPLIRLDIQATGMYAQVNHHIGMQEDYTRWPYAPHLVEGGEID